MVLTVGCMGYIQLYRYQSKFNALLHTCIFAYTILTAFIFFPTSMFEVQSKKMSFSCFVKDLTEYEITYSEHQLVYTEPHSGTMGNNFKFRICYNICSKFVYLLNSISS